MHDHEAFVGNLVGLPCWAVSGGGCTGSIFRLFLGERIPRERPVRNEKLDELARFYHPEYDIMPYCAWRLDGTNGPITGWLDPNNEAGAMVTGLEQLVGSTIERVRIHPPSWDLEIGFSGGRTLKIFCDATTVTDSAENWSIGHAGGPYLVATGGTLLMKSR